MAPMASVLQKKKSDGLEIVPEHIKSTTQPQSSEVSSRHSGKSKGLIRNPESNSSFSIQNSPPFTAKLLWKVD
jgi:hypothetical protein